MTRRRHAACPIAMLAMSFAAVPDATAGPLDKAGWTAELSTIAHGVSGTVTILDDDTYRVDRFSYDGRGIVVYLYLAPDDSSFETGLETGPQLVGPVEFDDDTLIVQLPDGETFDAYNAVSVWCVVANASFGHGTFSPPPCIADWDAGGSVEMIDLLLYLGEWFGGGGPADLSGDGIVDATDLLGFLDEWWSASNCP